MTLILVQLQGSGSREGYEMYVWFCPLGTLPLGPHVQFEQVCMDYPY